MIRSATSTRPTPESTPPPSAGRLFALATTAIGAFALLGAMPLVDGPPPTAEVLDWWDEVGTPNATVFVVRGLAQLAALWLLTVALLGLILVLAGSASPPKRGESAWTTQLWGRVAPHSIRRIAAAGLVITIATPAISSADESLPPVPLLVDLGAADSQTSERRDGPPIAEPPGPVLSDLGPAAHDEPALSAPESPSTLPAPELEQWHVQRGDHLWRIATDTLADRGEATTDANVARYWQRIIDLNRDEVGGNPDLIHSGMTLTLPGE